MKTPMAADHTQLWKKLYQLNCKHWDDAQKRRYLNIPNDPEEIDEIELESARELIQEINGKPPLED